MIANKRTLNNLFAAGIFIFALACFLVGKYLYWIAFYQWLIIALFFTWFFMVLLFVKVSNKNGYKAWWIWGTALFFGHPLEVLAMLIIWSFSGFVD